MTMIGAYRSAVISAPVQKVCAAIRDFNALPAWHSFARIAVGALRRWSFLHVQRPCIADASEELCHFRL